MNYRHGFHAGNFADVVKHIALIAILAHLKKKEAPLLNSARIKFLGLNLDYSIDKAVRKLSYHPSSDFREAMTASVKSRS